MQIHNKKYGSKIFHTEQIKEIDNYTILNEPIKSIDLMERAANSIFHQIDELFDCDSESFVVVCGPGNNGGDGLALTRIMHTSNIRVKALLLANSDNLSKDCQKNYERLISSNNGIISIIHNPDDFIFGDDDIIIDCIFGSGLKRQVDGFYADIMYLINNRNNYVIAVDIPSGLRGEDNSENNGAIIKADITLTLEFPFVSMMFAENYIYTGDIVIVPIQLHQDIINEMDSSFFQIKSESLGSIIKPRQRFDHKGIFGHALLVAGSYGKAGAAILAGKSCLRSGVGLLTIHCPLTLCGIIQTTLPEAMVSIDKGEKIISSITQSEYNAVGLGPGIGTEQKTADTILSFIKNHKKPLVIDADALNILSEHKNFAEFLPEKTILTPHPKEFERLFGKHINTYQVIQTIRKVCQKHNIIIIYKSGISIIGTPDGNIYFNNAGNPGMATAGAGDVLTGIILSLLAQSYIPEDAAILGVSLHSAAGDFAEVVYGYESLIAGDVIDYLPMAFKEFKN